jgi:hypothetical protein
MVLESKRFRGMFKPGEIVQLKKPCFTPGRLFEPGKYQVADLPDVAFDMGLVDHLPQVKGNSSQAVSVDKEQEAE